MRLYVSGPYSNPDPAKVAYNVETAESTAIALMAMGHTVFVPHLYHHLQERAKRLGIKFTYEDWMRQCLAFIPHCDAIVATQHEEAMLTSRGSVTERETALIHGLEIYASPNDVRPA